MTPEQKIQNKILKALKELAKTRPMYFEKRQAGGYTYRAGLPDIWGIVDGRHFEVEVKAPGENPSSLQLQKEKLFRSAGSFYWRGDDPKKFLDFLNHEVLDL